MSDESVLEFYAFTAVLQRAARRQVRCVKLQCNPDLTVKAEEILIEITAELTELRAQLIRRGIKVR